jgi:hypothetical protein
MRGILDGAAAVAVEAGTLSGGLLMRDAPMDIREPTFVRLQERRENRVSKTVWTCGARVCIVTMSSTETSWYFWCLLPALCALFSVSWKRDRLECNEAVARMEALCGKYLEDTEGCAAAAGAGRSLTLAAGLLISLVLTALVFTWPDSVLAAHTGMADSRLLALPKSVSGTTEFALRLLLPKVGMADSLRLALCSCVIKQVSMAAGLSSHRYAVALLSITCLWKP